MTEHDGIDEHELNLVNAAVKGDAAAWQQLLEDKEPRLRNMIRARLDPRLRRRIDVSDVLQEVYAAAANCLGDFCRNPKVPLYLWLRGVAQNTMLALHRRHLGVQMRDARRESAGQALFASSLNLAEMLVAHDTSPSMKVNKEQQMQKLAEALDQMADGDREILVMRHFEQLSNAQAAQVLGLDVSAASKRYGRALQRLSSMLAELQPD